MKISINIKSTFMRMLLMFLFLVEMFVMALGLILAFYNISYGYVLFFVGLAFLLILYLGALKTCKGKVDRDALLYTFAIAFGLTLLVAVLLFYLVSFGAVPCLAPCHV